MAKTIPSIFTPKYGVAFDYLNNNILFSVVDGNFERKVKLTFQCKSIVMEYLQFGYSETLKITDSIVIKKFMSAEYTEIVVKNYLADKFVFIFKVKETETANYLYSILCEMLDKY